MAYDQDDYNRGYQDRRSGSEYQGRRRQEGQQDYDRAPRDYQPTRQRYDYDRDYDRSYGSQRPQRSSYSPQADYDRQPRQRQYRDSYDYDSRGYGRDSRAGARREQDAYRPQRTSGGQRQRVLHDDSLPPRQNAYYEDDYGRPRSRNQEPYRQQRAPRQAPPRGPQPAYGSKPPRRGGMLDGLFAEFPWLRLVLAGIAVIIAVAVLVNIFSCVARMTSAPVPAQTSSEAASSTAEGDASSSSASGSSSSSSSEASQEGVESPWTDSGRFSTGDAELDQYIKQVCDEHSTAGATFDENAYNTNLYISQTDYIERASNQSPYGVGWDVEYAKQYFEKGNSGNCYNFCAVTQFVLRYFGYADAEAQPCVVHLESDSWGDHGLVFVTNKVNNQRCLVDDALSADGWMLDIDAYEYDVRNIDQNATVKGNVDALDDDEEPRHIEPGNLTEGHEND